MYKRFYDSIVNPRKLVDYRTDSLVKVFIYIILFSLLLSTRTVIEVATFDGLSFNAKTAISDEFADIDPSCEIAFSELSCDTEQTQLIYSDVMINYYLDSNETLDYNNFGTGYNIVVHKQNVYLIYGKSIFYDVKISELPLEAQNIDFGLQQTNADKFYESVFGAVDAYLMSEKGVWAPMLISFDFLGSFFMIMLFVLISAWMLRLRFKVIRFRHLFTMTVYSSTGLYVILILNTLYNISFFLVLILIIVAFRQNSLLSMEIMNRLSKNKNKKS